MQRIITKSGEVRLGYSARISSKAKKHIVSVIRRYNIHRSTAAELTGLALRLAAKLRGWINYFGAFRPSALRKVFSVLNKRFVRWYTNKVFFVGGLFFFYFKKYKLDCELFSVAIRMLKLFAKAIIKSSNKNKMPC